MMNNNTKTFAINPMLKFAITCSAVFMAAVLSTVIAVVATMF